ncbi:putative ribosomal protein l19 protein [Phaeoacremonium minimum UCRPA7]|uniref:Putative ribosomal protein l19 protein n=1 Tax=Phaeoacremonium minimum (strain UCR-PA7) TaxID=1286976 RepID=R8BSF5_PHAM7|nr:putative ribosomal protein l19 protein [Phaeoacremonium minimum UCRPA7]EOO02254.1 putative ribosomal protein l19 protein [Phaeoacremonium minimum UCRPA7]
MNAASLRRPLGCLKTTLRQTRQQRFFRRLLATAAETSQPSPRIPDAATFHAIQDTRTKKIRTGFAVYNGASAIPTLTPPPVNPVGAYHAEQIRKMDPTGARTRLFSKENADSAKVGDVLMVTTRRAAEPFSGVCISIRRRGIETAILLRGQLTKVGVEMWFKVYSRNVLGIEIIHRRPKRARRARLTYMRKPKHDKGSVDELVKNWRKSRNVFATRGGATAAKATAKSAKGAPKKK